ELRRIFEMRVAAELLAHVTVDAEMVEEIIALEDAVLLDHPVIGFRDEGLETRRRDIRMVVYAERVADVVNKSADDILLVPARLVRHCGGLQRMFQTRHRETAAVAFEQPQMVEDAIDMALFEHFARRSNLHPVVLGRVGEGGERSTAHRLFM